MAASSWQMKKFHEVEKIEFDDEFMTLFVDGKSFRNRIAEVSERLANASETQRRFFRVSPSGYGIHWPEIDEDLSVDGLIESAKQRRYPRAAKISAAVLHDKPKR